MTAEVIPARRRATAIAAAVPVRRVASEIAAAVPSHRRGTAIAAAVPRPLARLRVIAEAVPARRPGFA